MNQFIINIVIINQMVMLPVEILWEIAKKSPSTFFAMAVAIPWLGRESLRPHVQAQMKAYFTVKRQFIEFDNESRTEWILPNGKYHSNYDKPAIVCDDGSQMWYNNGIMHRASDEPARIIWIRNTHLQEWYRDGQLHRDGDKPAKITRYIEEWYRNGKLHRDGGPSVMYKI